MGLRATLLGLAALGAALACGADPQTEHLDRMATEHAGDRGDVAGAAGSREEADVPAEAVVYGSLEGQPLRGYLARPPGQRQAPGVLVIHEWWGLNENVREMTRQLAAAGYTALAVDLYRGRHTADPLEARGLAGTAMQRSGELEENLRQAQIWLRERAGAPRVGVIGWCFGGGWSLRTALLLPDVIDAAVIYYGRLETDPQRLAELDMPILGIFGGLDRGIPLAQVRAFEQALDGLGKNATILVYEDADHAFANPSGNRYQPEAAADAWRKTLKFFEQYLKVGG